MRRLPLLFALLLLTALFGAACSKNTLHGKAAREAEIPGTTADVPLPMVATRRTAAFASLPDRGNLLGYPAQPVERQEHASTWHRADISEEHALRAVVTGEMTVTAPDGQPIRLRYQRHIEHPNGNWTWIGHDEYGAEAIVTFGEKAVFGSVPRRGSEDLQLATSGGHSWVVEADPDKQYRPDPKRPDYVVPPELAQSFVLGEPVTASASMEAVTPAAVGTTVDVALGYTTGFASEVGGDSQAITRLQNLVDITNQAYVNSQINAQVRLVRTVSVNYPDATDNNDALAKLSGYQSGTGTIPVDPAFSALRTAREQYGADLVSLVRRFRTPENQGCGVAWLIGGDQSRIDGSDAPWGYSVVSDDLDHGDVNESDNKTYVCRKETLAHEMGHNMGQAHNSEDSEGTPGAHAYSYGYRETSNAGFYTVMAYRIDGSSQFSIRHFANPNVLYSGRPTGVVDVSDNARSLTQTMPLIASFRASLVALGRVSGDIDGDGRADLFWSNRSLQLADWWLMNGAAWRFGGRKEVAAQYRVAGRGDFDGDGRSDVLWEDGSTIWIWRNEPVGGFSIHFVANHPGNGWVIAGVGDVNGDSRSDLFWSNRTLQRADWWTMQGASPAFAGSKAVASQYRVVGLGDFDADGRADVLWQDQSTIWIWRSEVNGFSVHFVANQPGSGWSIAGLGDLNGDARTDLFWSNRPMQQADWWLMNGASPSYGGSKFVPEQYRVAAVRDFNGDGRADVLWEDGATVWVWTREASGDFGIHFVSNHPGGAWSIIN